MALDFGKTENTSSNAKADQPKTQIWLNVGYKTADGKFVNLPIGIPIDTMNKLQIRGSNEDWNKLSQARNKMLEQMQKHGSSMAAGAEEIVNGLIIKIKRVAAEADVDPHHNEYLADNEVSFGTKQAAE